MRIVALLLLLVCTASTTAQNTTAGEKAVMTEIVRLGGKADIDTTLFFEARVVVEFETANDALLAALKKHPEIGGIKVADATKCTDKGLAALKDLPNLRKIVFGKATLTPTGASTIGQCKELRYLGLVGCGVTDAEFTGMKGLTMLEHLALSENPQITDKSMATVKGFERLRVLYLNKTGITDKGLAELKGLDGLRTLSVKATKVTSDAADKFIDQMPNLRTIGQ
ncbi:MAG: hypothetical protein C0467_09380 [Planctomycetaceae bacterium]|nr:hypothetical protein [Planctomycetaceae bacterium]